MQIYDNYLDFNYDDSLLEVLLSDLISEFGAQDVLPGFEQHPNHAIHKALDCKEPLEIHLIEFKSQSQPWIIRIYDNREALIGQVGDQYKFYDNVGKFVYEHRKRIAEGGEGEGTFNAFAKEYEFNFWMMSLLSGGRLE